MPEMVGGEGYRPGGIVAILELMSGMVRVVHVMTRDVAEVAARSETGVVSRIMLRRIHRLVLQMLRTPVVPVTGHAHERVGAIVNVHLMQQPEEAETDVRWVQIVSVM